MAVAGMAQETMYLIKGNKVVAKYSVSDVDYLSFRLPEGVVEPKAVDIDTVEIGKNYINYKVETLSPSTNYVHMVILESFLDYLLQSNYETTLAEASQEQVVSSLKAAMEYYGYLGTGTKTYNMKDGADDGDGTEFEVLAGQRYILAACDLTPADELGDVMSYKTITTTAPGQSAGTLTVKYDGLNDNGDAMFSFDFSQDITKIRTMYGLKSVLDNYIAEKGFDYTFSLFGQSWAPADITADGNGWPVAEKDEYVMYAVGIDANGDWVKTSVTQTITPMEKDNSPVITIYSKEKGSGSVKVNFEISPSNVDEAYVRLMDENTADDKLNAGYTLAELAAGGDATDITSDINGLGEYTYANNSVPAGWQTLLISGKNSDGTTVMRINFNANVENSEWDITTSNGKSSSAAAKAGAPSLMRGSSAILSPTKKSAGFKRLK